MIDTNSKRKPSRGVKESVGDVIARMGKEHALTNAGRRKVDLQQTRGVRMHATTVDGVEGSGRLSRLQRGLQSQQLEGDVSALVHNGRLQLQQLSPPRQLSAGPLLGPSQKHSKRGGAPRRRHHSHDRGGAGVSVPQPLCLRLLPVGPPPQRLQSRAPLFGWTAVHSDHAAKIFR